MIEALDSALKDCLAIDRSVNGPDFAQEFNMEKLRFSQEVIHGINPAIATTQIPPLGRWSNPWRRR